MKTGEDIALFFEKEKFLEKKRDRQIFKKALQTIGRNDLVVKLEKCEAGGESFWNLSNIFNELCQ